MQYEFSELLRKPWFAPTVAGVVAFGGGFGAGYFLGKRKREVVYYDTETVDIVVDDGVSAYSGHLGATVGDLERLRYEDNNHNPTPIIEPSQMWRSDDVVRTTDPRPDPSGIQVEQDDVEVELFPNEDDGSGLEDEEPVGHNLFANSTDGWVYEDELKTRTPNAPYILHKDEFFANEMDFSQLTVTYYADDEIVADDGDQPIYGHARILGELNFGHGSGDPSVVYVRNEERKAEYEVLLDTGSYTREVLGIGYEDATQADDIRHSHNLAKFRLE